MILEPGKIAGEHFDEERKHDDEEPKETCQWCLQSFDGSEGYVTPNGFICEGCMPNDTEECARLFIKR